MSYGGILAQAGETGKAGRFDASAGDSAFIPVSQRQGPQPVSSLGGDTVVARG
jgi:hypothetical protein